MKRLILLFAGLLIGLTTVSATELNHQKFESKLDIKKRYRYAQPIMFVERGVEFLIFPDGSFDFNTDHVYNEYNNSYYRYGNSRRSRVNKTYGAPNRYSRYNRHPKKGVSISHDRDGKVRRIGNVYLNYDRHGKIKRAGSIYMSYKRGRGYHATLNQVGGLQVHYNRWGEIVNTRGQVKQFSDFCNFCGTQSCNIDHVHRDKDRHYDIDWNDDQYHDDIYEDNYYYFKQNGKVKKHKKRKH